MSMRLGEVQQAISNIWDKPHKDNLLDIDDCLRIDNVEGFYVKLTKIGHEPNVFKNDYIVL